MAEVIVSGYARMWPRAVFGKSENSRTLIARGCDFLDKPGVYILYRDDVPYYIGQAHKLRHRLQDHANHPDRRYYHFWNFFSAFAIESPKHRDLVEGILIAALPTAANSARPKLDREKMPPEVSALARAHYAK